MGHPAAAAVEEAQAPVAAGPRRGRFRTIPWQPPALQDIWTKWATVITGGVQTGKTVLATAVCFDWLTRLLRGKRGAWVAPETFNLDPMWEALEPRLRRAGALIREHPARKAFCPEQDGSRFITLTAKNLKKLLSKHYDWMIIDECGQLPADAWKLIWSRIVGCDHVLFLGSWTGTPDWQRVIKMARSDKAKRWGYHHITTVDAGIVSEEKLKELEKDVPLDVWEQDILGKGSGASNSVFRRIEQAATADWHTPPRILVPGRYELTWDVAKSHDWSVLGVWRGLRLVAAYRWHYEDYTLQVVRVAAIAREWAAKVVIMDATGPGAVAADYLIREGAREVDDDGSPLLTFEVLPVEFTAQSKPAMIMATEKAFENGLITLVDAKHGDPYDEIVDELKAFERKRSHSGIRYLYEAPSGGFDDCVSMIILRFAGGMGPGIA